PALERKHRTASQRDEQPSTVHESLNLPKTRVPNPTGDVIRLSRCSEARCEFRLLKRHGPPCFWDTLNLFRKLQVNVRIQKHVVLTTQLPSTDILVSDIRVRN